MRTGLLATLLLLLTTPAFAGVVSLKAESTISADQLMLSDLFVGVPFEQDKVLGSAPAPGRSLTYNTRDLIVLAHRYNLDWQPSGNESLTISRATQSFDASKIAEVVSAQLSPSASASNHTEVRLDNPLTVLQAAAGRDIQLSVANLDVNTSTQRFTAVARLSEGANTLTQTSISGRIRYMVSMPVVNRALRKGDVIRAADLAWQDVEVSPATNDIIADADDLIGMTPRNALRPGVPVRAVDLIKPVLVAKGSMVALVYQVGHLLITTEGRAVSDGAQGETVRVANLKSNRIVEGTVTTDGQVRLGMASAPATNQTALLR